MSFPLSAYLIKLKLFQSIFGSKSASLLKSLVTDPQVAGLMKAYDAASEGTPVLEIVKDFFDGDLRHKEEAGKYWYVVNLICIKYGVPMQNRHWKRQEGIDNLYKSAMFSPHSIGIKLPKRGKKQKMGSLIKEDLPEVRKLLEKLFTDDLIEEDEANALMDWLRLSAQNEKELVVFFN